MADAYTHSAVVAAVDVAQRFGLPVEDLQVLHERSNVLVRLGLVIARVALATRLVRTDPAASLARDVAVSRLLTERGVRGVSPTSDPLLEL
jgi:hypothetical protein